MSSPNESFTPEEQALIAKARENFASLFKWVGFLNDVVQKELGTAVNVHANMSQVQVADGKVIGAIEGVQRNKPPLVVPFEIQGDRITIDHQKFEYTDRATKEKRRDYTIAGSDEISRILSELMQTHFG
jgi:hypothetical protein